MEVVEQQEKINHLRACLFSMHSNPLQTVSELKASQETTRTEENAPTVESGVVDGDLTRNQIETPTQHRHQRKLRELTNEERTHQHKE